MTALALPLLAWAVVVAIDAWRTRRSADGLGRGIARGRVGELEYDAAARAWRVRG